MSILRWPGSKARLLPKLRPFLDHSLLHARTFHDVFVGGGSVLLDVARRFPGVHLAANDLDPGVAALWRVVSGPVAALERLKSLVLTTVPTLDTRQWWLDCPPEDDVERSFQVLFVNRTSYSGNPNAGPLGGRSQAGPTKVGSRWNAERIAAEIDKAHDLLDGRLTVTCEDGAEAVGRLVGQQGVCLYVDPPYYSVSDELYRVGMPPRSHVRLADRLKGTSNWVLSYDDAPGIRALYNWASVTAVPAPYSAARARGERPARQELVVVPPDHPVAAREEGRAA